MSVKRRPARPESSIQAICTFGSRGVATPGNLKFAVETPPLLANHEIDRGAEAALSVQRGNWFLQDKVCPHLEGLLRAGASVQNCEGDGVFVAGALAQALQHAQRTFEIVAVYKDSVKLLGAQDFLPGTDATAHFNVNRQVLQGRLEDTDNLGIPAEKQRFQPHRSMMVAL